MGWHLVRRIVSDYASRGVQGHIESITRDRVSTVALRTFYRHCGATIDRHDRITFAAVGDIALDK